MKIMAKEAEYFILRPQGGPSAKNTPNKVPAFLIKIPAVLYARGLDTPLLNA